MRTSLHNSRIFKSSLLIFLAAAFSFSVCGQTVITRNPEEKPPAAEKSDNTGIKAGNSEEEDPEIVKLERAAFEYLNEQRTKSKQKPLKWNDELAALARRHSKEMATKKFFSVKGANGETIDEEIKDAGITKYTALGRLVGAAAGEDDPAKAVIDRWISSLERRQYLFDNPWSETGVGIFIADDGMFYLTQDFLTR
ncbi:MAG: CAP domain-containing protein [Pyrinomonadaceae bacterium]